MERNMGKEFGEQDFCSVKAAPHELFTKYKEDNVPLQWNFYLHQMNKLSITNSGTSLTVCAL